VLLVCGRMTSVAIALDAILAKLLLEKVRCVAATAKAAHSDSDTDSSIARPSVRSYGWSGGGASLILAFALAAVAWAPRLQLVPPPCSGHLLVQSSLAESHHSRHLQLRKMRCLTCAKPGARPVQVAPLDTKAAGSSSKQPHLLLRLLVPAPMCGIIIGSHGVTIKAFVQRSGANVRCGALPCLGFQAAARGHGGQGSRWAHRHWR
jgi:hypothetical protein